MATNQPCPAEPRPTATLSAVSTPSPDAEPSPADPRYRALPTARSARIFVSVGLPLFACGLILAWLADSHESWLRLRDQPINQWMFDTGSSSGLLHSIATGVSWLGAGERTVPLVVVVTLALLVFRQWRWALYLLVSSQVGFLISNGIKNYVGRTRPPFTVISPRQIGMSFPSGHTFAGIATWGAFAIIVLYLLPRPWSTGIAVTLFAFGILNGPSRLLLGKHWVSDVIAAWLLGTGWLLLVWAGFLVTLAPRPPDSEPPPPAAPGTVDVPA